jgi:hypothetical protein
VVLWLEDAFLVEVESGGHVELESAVGVDVGPEQWCEASFFVGSDAVVEFGDLGQDAGLV